MAASAAAQTMPSNRCWQGPCTTIPMSAVITMTMMAKHMPAADMAARHTPAADTAMELTAAVEKHDTKSSVERAVEYLTQLPYWDTLSTVEQELVRHNAAIQRYEKGQFILSDLYDCLGMVLVLRGEIRTYLLSEEGREVTLFRLYEGDPATDGLVEMRRGSICLNSPDDLRKLIE